MKWIGRNVIYLLSAFVFLAFSSSHKNKVSIKEEAKKTNGAGEIFSNKTYPWPRDERIYQWQMKDISTPKGYKREPVGKNSFADWLRHLPLKRKNAPVLLHNRRMKVHQDFHEAVIDIDVGEKDLQQCADAVMRLRAEYLYDQGQYDSLSFHFVNGFKASYSKWRRGYMIWVKGNKSGWKKAKNAQKDYKSFRKYLDIVFTYANTYSLGKEMKPVEDTSGIKIGDVFIQGGFPGHAVIVVDVAKNKKGQKAFLLAQSYMPAQSIHVLKSPFEISPWYEVPFGEKLKTPEWTFERGDLKSF